jgi:hypothetical protein
MGVPAVDGCVCLVSKPRGGQDAEDSNSAGHRFDGITLKGELVSDRGLPPRSTLPADLVIGILSEQEQIAAQPGIPIRVEHQ